MLPSSCGGAEALFLFFLPLWKAVLELSWKVQDEYNLLLGESAFSSDTFFNLSVGQRIYWLKAALQGILEMSRRNSAF